MKAMNFIRNYEQALASQDWKRVEPLMHKDIEVIFSDGSKHIGIKNVQKAFEQNFALIKDEQYRISNIMWLKNEAHEAVFSFDFFWSGMINGETCQGGGKGISTLAHVESKWLLLRENLNA